MLKKLLLTGIAASSAQVGAFDLPKFGLEIGGSTYNFSDFEGKGDASSYTQLDALNLLAYIDIDSASRLRTRYSNRSIEINPSQSVIGQNGHFQTISTAFQTRYDFNMTQYVWVGFGAGVASYSISDRYLVDEDGYQAKAFEDINEYGVLGILNLSREINLGNYLDLGLNGEYEHHFNGKLSTFSLGVSVLLD